MSGVPDMWRVELWHPLVVHMPIGLLLGGVLAWLAGGLADEDGDWGFVRPAGRLAVAAGTLSAWVAVYTGDLADAQVVRSLCDPTVVEQHETLAWTTAAVFSVAVAVDLGARYVNARGVQIAMTWAAGIGLVVGAALLGYVGHLGASLVYQQGAAVYQPTEQCTEFE